jgi:hypothetical protein
MRDHTCSFTVSNSQVICTGSGPLMKSIPQGNLHVLEKSRQGDENLTAIAYRA